MQQMEKAKLYFILQKVRTNEESKVNEYHTLQQSLTDLRPLRWRWPLRLVLLFLQSDTQERLWTRWNREVELLFSGENENGIQRIMGIDRKTYSKDIIKLVLKVREYYMKSEERAAALLEKIKRESPIYYEMAMKAELSPVEIEADWADMDDATWTATPKADIPRPETPGAAQREWNRAFGPQSPVEHTPAYHENLKKLNVMKDSIKPE